MRLSVLVLVTALLGCGPPFVPEDFEPPSGFATEQLVVRPILASDAEADYEAVMESRELIHTVLLNDAWPAQDFTLAENRRDLERKERRFASRESFTYTVVTPDESRVLGCVYINRGRGGPDAAVFMWVRSSEHERGLDPILEQAVRTWMQDAWPFDWVVYPGRAPAQQKRPASS